MIDGIPVTEHDATINTDDGRTDAVSCRPEGDGQWPGVLYLTDVGGIRPTTCEQIRRLAADGYLVLMPNLFYRIARPPVFEVKPNDWEGFQKRMTELTAPLTPEKLDRDLSTYVDTLTSDRACAQE